MRIFTVASILIAVCCTSCFTMGPHNPPVVKAEKSFASGGSIEMELSGGNYSIKPAAGDTVRVTFSGNTGNATADLNTNGSKATLTVKDTPHNNFNAVIEVPKTSDVVVRLDAGNLEMAALTGSKDVDSKAGNVEITAGSPDDYASVEARVTAGNVDGGAFANAASGIGQHITWSGHGKYTLRANLGAGNLELK